MRITGTVRTGLGFFAAIVGIFGSFGCGSSSSGTEAPVDLASGGVEVYTAPSYSSSAQSVTRINIVDAVQDDKRIIALLATGDANVTITHIDSTCEDCNSTVTSAGGGAAFELLVSEDSGATWTQHPLLFAADPELKYVAGVHAALGAVVVETAGARVGAGGQTYGYFHLQQFDVKTDKWVANTALDGKEFYGHFAGRGADLIAVAPTYTQNGYEINHYRFGGSQYLVVPLSQIPAKTSCPPFMANPAGTALGSYCTLASGDLVNIQVDATGLSWVVSANEPLPPAFSASGNPVGQNMTTWGYVYTTSDRTNMLALGIENHALTGFTLGAGGGQVPPGGYAVHEKFDTLMAVGDKLVDIDLNKQLKRYDLPSPCRDGSCGVDQHLAFLLPQGAGQYLGFFIVNSRQPDPGEGPAYHEHVYAVPVTLGLTADPPPTPTPGLFGYPTSTPTGSLVSACVAMESCWGTGDPIAGCVKFLQTVDPNDPDRQAFVAAAGTNCDAMNVAYANVSNSHHGMPAYACSQQSHCEGDAAVCPGATPSSAASAKYWCSDIGDTCIDHGSGALCADPNPDDTSGSLCPGLAIGVVGMCADSTAIYCYGGELHYVDCKALGFTTCIASGASAICQ